MEELPCLRRAQLLPSNFEVKRLRLANQREVVRNKEPTGADSTPPVVSFNPTLQVHHNLWDGGSATETPAAEMEETPSLFAGMQLTSAATFDSPCHYARSAMQPAPFAYCETDTFGGDETTRASVSRVSARNFRVSSPSCRHYDVPSFSKTSSARNSLELAVSQREIARLSEKQDGDTLNAVKVRFDDDIQVYEYDKPVYEESVDDSMAGFHANSLGLENWTKTFSETLDSWDDCISAPAHIAFIPLIPNRRLVGGGDNEIEKRSYDRRRRRSTSDSSSPTSSDDLPPLLVLYPSTSTDSRENDHYSGPCIASPTAKLTVESPVGVDKLLAESLRPTEDSQEPNTFGSQPKGVFVLKFALSGRFICTWELSSCN